ncbi:DUF4304 domain-containing protein [Bradyrhizobium erythrophlei]|uniref:DUF4304 domain-containing protein n=1 Tax=Bradyrhizobium erythrophlei TaxID=1437360 RepID=UPI0035E643BE
MPTPSPVVSQFEFSTVALLSQGNGNERARQDDPGVEEVVQPYLRSAKFSGAFPHYRRIGNDRIDLVTFQFDKNGGGFIMETAQCSVDGIITAWGAHIAPSKATAWDVHPDKRTRIKAKAGAGTNAWFRFDESLPSIVAEDALKHLKAALGRPEISN